MPDNKNEEDLYHTHSKLANALARIKEDETLLPEHRDIIIRFDKKLQAEDVRAKRRIRYARTLPVLLRKLGKPLKQTTKDDLINLVGWINSGGERNWSETTKVEYREEVKRVWKFANDYEKEDKPKEVRFIRTSKKPTPPTWLPSDELIQKAINAAHSSRDKFIIAALAEGGFRTGEFIYMTLGDWQADGDLIRVQVPESGKTGARVLYLHDVIPYYKMWLSEHPQPDKPDAPLVMNINGTVRRMIPAMLVKVVKTAFNRAGSTKRVTVQLLRKRCSTEMAANFSGEQLNARQGWTTGSKMAAYYVAFSDKHKRAAACRQYGMKDESKPKEKTVKCVNPLCKTDNPSDRAFCYKCHAALTVDAAMDVLRVRNMIQSDQMEYYKTGDMKLVLAKLEARLAALEGEK